MNWNWKLVGMLMVAASLTACTDDNPAPTIEEPEFYTFERDGVSTVDFTGQTQRIAMATEIASALINSSLDEATIDAMFTHQQGNSDFAGEGLNASDKNVRSKVAASMDYFSANATDAAAIKADFDSWIAGQANEVFPNWAADASAGSAGFLQQSGGGATRYLNSNGLEYNQAFAKGLTGAMMTDQALNNYLSTLVLDAGTNVEDNSNEVLESGKNYTNMEHKWDEAYGYLYGASADGSNPNATIGSDDNFLNRYIGQVNADPDFNTIAEDIFNAFKLGRAAIVAGRYNVRDQQIKIIKENVSKVIAVRAVYYLQRGKTLLEAANPDYADAFHQLSEGFGFVYSLQFTQDPNTGEPYFTRTEVQDLIDAIYPTDGDNRGFWDVTTTDLQMTSETIATAFGFTVAQAASAN